MVGTARRRAFARPTESMQPEHAVDGAELGRLNQPGMRDGDGKQRAFELRFPKGEEILQRRKIREQIVVLPHIGLQQPVAVRAAVHDFCRSQTIAKDLLAKVLGNFPTLRNPSPRDHAYLHCWSAFPRWLPREPPGGDALT